MQTPAASSMSKTAIWATPAVTPKFDPRLPITPAIPGARPFQEGEPVMSIRGSPLLIDENRQKGKTVAKIRAHSSKRAGISLAIPTSNSTGEV